MIAFNYQKIFLDSVNKTNYEENLSKIVVRYFHLNANFNIRLFDLYVKNDCNLALGVMMSARGVFENYMSDLLSQLSDMHTENAAKPRYITIETEKADPHTITAIHTFDPLAYFKANRREICRYVCENVAVFDSWHIDHDNVRSAMDTDIDISSDAFEVMMNKAISDARAIADGCPIDIRVSTWDKTNTYLSNEVFDINSIGEIYNAVSEYFRKGKGFDAEIYANYEHGAESLDKGIMKNPNLKIY